MNAFKIFLLLVFVGAFFNANGQKKVLQTEIHRQINVNPDALVEIENQFGDLNLISWEENHVDIEVVITVKGYNQKKIQDKLDNIDVYFRLSPEHVIARTQINESWGFNFFNNSRLNFSIDYTVKLPRSNTIDIENDYGSVVLNALDGEAKIKCDYGKLLIGELNAENNTISFDYTSNSSFVFIKGGKIRADYSGFEVEEAGVIDLQADYTSADFRTIQELDFQNDYGKLVIGKINRLSGNGDYLTLKIGMLFQELDLNNEFGLIRVNQIMPAVKKIHINSEYTGIQLGISSLWDFLYEIDLEFASLKSEVSINHNIERIQSMEKYYKGYYLKEKSSNTLNITSEFGNIKLTSNP